MTKRIGLALALVALAFFGWSTLAGAQQPQPRAPARKAAQPALPPGHPPIRPGKGKDTRNSAAQRQKLEEMLRRQGKLPPKRPGSVPAGATKTPPKKKYPKDDHGHCRGDGPDDRPKDINLVHGWWGVDNEKAEKAPPKGGGDDWWGRNKYFNLGNKAWWLWRLTPHPYRYENHDDHCDPKNEPVPLLANIINLGVLIFLFVRFGKKPLAEALSTRKENIMREIDKSREIKAAAQQRLDRYEDELDHLDDKLEALRKQYAAEGEVEKSRLIEEIAQTRERMIADTNFRIAQEGKAARDNLSREALEGALGAAEELLRKTITQADHQRLAEEYLDEIGPALRDGAKGGRA